MVNYFQSPRKPAFYSSFFIRVFVFSCALIFQSFAYADCNNKELINGWGGEWVPFIMGTADNPSGLDMDILDAVIAKAGCKWRNTEREVPWARHLKLVEAGKIDLATAASWTQERAN